MQRHKTQPHLTDLFACKCALQVTYVCREPWQNPNAKPQDLKIKEHIKVAPRPRWRST